MPEGAVMEKQKNRFCSLTATVGRGVETGTQFL